MADVFLDDVVLPANIAREMVGGPEWRTERVETTGGFIKRNQVWARPRWKWTFSYNTQRDFMLQQLRSLFLATQGGLGFLMRDWADYQVSNTDGRVLIINNLLMTNKRYTFGARSFDRRISKPTGTPIFYRNATVVSGATVDNTTGLVTLPAITLLTVSAVVTGTITTVTTSTAHGMANGDLAQFGTIAGMTQLSNVAAIVTVIDTTHFSIAINSTTFTAFSSGSVKKVALASETLGWAGQFNVPVTWTFDHFAPSTTGRDGSGGLLFTWSSIEVVELRL